MLNTQQKRFLILEQSLMPGLFNFAINAWFVSFLLDGHADLPLFTSQGSNVLVDTLATLFLLPAITCLIVTPLVASIVRKRAQLRTKKARATYPFIKFLPANLWGRSGIIGLVAMILFTPFALLGVVVVFGGYPISVDAYIWYKGAYAAVVSAIIGPMIAWASVCDQSARS